MSASGVTISGQTTKASAFSNAGESFPSLLKEDFLRLHCTALSETLLPRCMTLERSFRHAELENAMSPGKGLLNPTALSLHSSCNCRDDSNLVKEGCSWFLLRLNATLYRYPNVPLVALTATATPLVQQDVIQQLCLKNCVIFRSSFNRPNLRYTSSLLFCDLPASSSFCVNDRAFYEPFLNKKPWNSLCHVQSDSQNQEEQLQTTLQSNKHCRLRPVE